MGSTKGGVVTRRRSHWLLVLAMLAALGCSKKYDIVPVHGALTYEGQPVPGMIVRFTPAAGRFSDALTSADGSFDMTYTLDTLGVEVDSHEITVIWSPPTEAGGAKPPDVQSKVLADFKKHGPIAVKIEKPQKNFEIKLPR